MAFGIVAGVVVGGLLGGKGGGGQAAPDMSAQNIAAQSQSDTAKVQAQLGQDQLAWAKQIYGDTAPDRAQAIADTHNVTQAQLQSMAQQNGIAADYDNYNKSVFRPLEQGIVSDAANYDTTARRQQAAGDAMSDVATQFDNQAQQDARSAAASGVDPSSGNFAATRAMTGVNEAASKAAAGTTAIRNVEAIGTARKMDAASLGRNLPSNQATSAQIALSAGSGAAQSAQGIGAINAQGQQILNSGYGGAQNALAGAQNGYAGAGRIYGNMADQRINVDKANAASMQGIGSAIGSFAGSNAGSNMIAGWLSDENEKTDIKSTSPDKALKAIEDTPVKSWAYKKGSVADDGGQTHTGAMAQDMQANMGNDVAPGGKMLDPISLHGVTMNAIKALSHKVNKLAAQRGIPMARHA